jgi:pyridinium-3,5-bisthiocarboxylic acid mononucleotide nickel chelatase
VICSPERICDFADFLLKQTTSIGLRWRIDNRVKAHRSIREVQTEYGPVRIKVAEVNGNMINSTPEYEDCKRLALENNVPLKEIIEQARLAATAPLRGVR